MNDLYSDTTKELIDAAGESATNDSRIFMGVIFDPNTGESDIFSAHSAEPAEWTRQMHSVVRALALHHNINLNTLEN